MPRTGDLPKWHQVIVVLQLVFYLSLQDFSLISISFWNDSFVFLGSPAWAWDQKSCYLRLDSWKGVLFVATMPSKVLSRREQVLSEPSLSRPCLRTRPRLCRTYVECRCWLAPPCRVAGCRRCLTSAARATHDFANTAPPCLASRTVVMLHRCAFYRHNAHVTLVYYSIYWTTYCFSRVCRPVHLTNMWHYNILGRHVVIQFPLASSMRVISVYS